MKFPTVRAVLLDVEGTTSSIAFVYEVMFPYVRRNVRGFLEREIDCPDVQATLDQMAIDAGFPNAQAWLLGKAEEKISKGHSNEEWIAGQVNLLMDSDSKSTGLKALQGLIWRSGFEGGELTSHLFPDVVPAIENWLRQAIAIGIYSSGSVVAQRLFFGHTPEGDLTSFFVRHYDTTIGSKRAAASYHRIAADFGYHPSEILFLSDVFEELEAASAAGFQAVAVERPGNAPLPEVYRGARITSFSQLDLTNESMT